MEVGVRLFEKNRLMIKKGKKNTCVNSECGILHFSLFIHILHSCLRASAAKNQKKWNHGGQ